MRQFYACFCVVWGIVFGVCAASATAQAEPDAGIRRVVVLAPRAIAPTPQVQQRIEQERARRSKARRKSKRRMPVPQVSSASNAAAPTLSASNVPAPTIPTVSIPNVAAQAGKDSHAPKTEANSAPRMDAGRPKQNLSQAPAAPFAATQPSGASTSSGKTDVVPPEQRASLAQALFVDALTERLQDRLGIVVAGDNEITAACQTLHLTPEQAAQPDNARRLCVQLHCQAALIPHITACTLREAATRDAAVFAQIETIFAPTQAEQVPSGKAAANDTPPLAQWPARLEVAGTASSDRVLLHSAYKKPQADLIRDATQQAVNILLHALRTGEQAPFMRMEDRIAVTPVLAPGGADKLIFTASGRRVMPASVGELHASVTALFLPDLLPLAPGHILNENDVAVAFAAQGGKPKELWRGEDQPAINRVQTLGRSLRVDYVLLSRVTDVELSESEGASDATGNASATERQRAVRVEAVAALVRVGDGVLLWHDRAIATMAAPLPMFTVNGKSPSTQSLVHDATRFALVELQRRLRRYRSTFER